MASLWENGKGLQRAYSKSKSRYPSRESRSIRQGSGQLSKHNFAVCVAVVFDIQSALVIFWIAVRDYDDKLDSVYLLQLWAAWIRSGKLEASKRREWLQASFALQPFATTYAYFTDACRFITFMALCPVRRISFPSYCIYVFHMNFWQLVDIALHGEWALWAIPAPRFVGRQESTVLGLEIHNGHFGISIHAFPFAW